MISKFTELYQENQNEQKLRYEALAKDFAELFGNADNIEYFSAPGRTEVGGNHTDHQHGRVLAAAVSLDIIAAAVKRDDNVIVLKSKEYSKIDEVDISNLDVVDAEREKSASLIRGICAGCVNRG